MHTLLIDGETAITIPLIQTQSGRPVILTGSVTPAVIASAFEAVGRTVPPAEYRAGLANALNAHRGDIDFLMDMIRGDHDCDAGLRVVASDYQMALAEAADPAVWSARLLVEAAQQIRWAE